MTREDSQNEFPRPVCSKETNHSGQIEEGQAILDRLKTGLDKYSLCLINC